jgi:hypothetical protein
MLRKTWTALGLGGLALFSALGVAFPQTPRPVRIAGVDWEPTLQQAQARAVREGKPIFLLHLFGRLDEEFC